MVYAIHIPSMYLRTALFGCSLRPSIPSFLATLNAAVPCRMQGLGPISVLQPLPYHPADHAPVLGEHTHSPTVLSPLLLVETDGGAIDDGLWYRPT
jgi:hypothetical protein